MMLVAENVHDKLQAGLKSIQEMEHRHKSAQQKAMARGERSKIRSLEGFVRMPWENYLAAHGQIKRFAAQAHQAKTEMIEANLRLVISIAKKYTNRGQSFLDLIQEGTMGLMKGAQKFRDRRGDKLSHRATF